MRADNHKHEVNIPACGDLGPGYMLARDALASMPYKAWEMCRRLVAIETIQLDEGLVS